SIRLDLGISRPRLQEILNERAGVLGWIERSPRRGDVLVEFSKATVRVEGKEARIVAGTALYPAKPVVPTVIEREIAGFTLVISSLRLTPTGARGEVTVRLPPTIAATDSCQPATLDLGEVHLTPSCELYFDAPDRAYGPWLIGD